MIDINQTEYQSLMLAALLHDAGKISQRESGAYHLKHAEFSGNFISSLKDYFGSEFCKEIANLIEKHHGIPSTRNEYILHIADKLASSERLKEERSRFRSNEAALVAAASRVEFKDMCENEMYFNLSTLRTEKEVLFPVDEPKVEKDAYRKIWDGFVKKVKSLGKYKPSDFKTLFFILKEFGSFVPSATPWEGDEYNRTVPDVSLFDHSKVTCAIAACLKQMSEEEFSNTEMSQLVNTLKQHYMEYDPDKKNEILNSSEPAKKQLFIFLRADIAGIQKFIYSITTPKAETKGASKRLRGRSFYVSLLTDVISDWIIREMNLPVANILFCGGGRFDILLPDTIEVNQKIEEKEIRNELDKWLLKEFCGELSIQIATVKIAPKDFFDFKQVYNNAEDALANTKMRKFDNIILQNGFFQMSEEVEDICNSCMIVPVPKGQICDQCENHKEIGSKLPKKDFISFVYGEYNGRNDVAIKFKKFGVTVLLQDKYDIERILKEKSNTELCVYRINPECKDENALDFLSNKDESKPVSFGFKFLGNAAPINKEGDVMEFDEIANQSEGAKYLGIMKMDVDYLGLLFGLGINPPSISRFSTLSSYMEIFFGAWLNKICESKGNVFYIVYSGGDDLFIIGPWDKIIDLAEAVYSDFRKYTCQNPNITLSCGILFVKPHFPIQRFAFLVDEELKESKSKGRDKVTLFDETVEWKNNSKSFDSLISFGKKISEQVEDKNLSRGFVYFLRKLEKEYNLGTDDENLNWIPQFFYAHARRVNPEVEEKLLLITQVMEKKGKLKIPVSYVSLKTRKE